MLVSVDSVVVLVVVVVVIAAATTVISCNQVRLTKSLVVGALRKIQTSDDRMMHECLWAKSEGYGLIRCRSEVMSKTAEEV